MVLVQYVWKGQTDLGSMIKMVVAHTTVTLVVLAMVSNYYRKYTAGALQIV
jgi:hypothetical protein